MHGIFFRNLTSVISEKGLLTPLINLLMFGIRPKIIILSSNKNNTSVAEKGEVGDKVLH